jgi:hypothetical protein
MPKTCCYCGEPIEDECDEVLVNVNTYMHVDCWQESVGRD